MRKILLAGILSASMGVPVLVSALPPGQFTLSLRDSGGKAYALDTYNHFEFSNDGWVISSSDDASVTALQVPFTMYNRITFDERSGLEDAVACDDKLSYDSQSKTVILNAIRPEDYRLTICSSLGVMMLDKTMDTDASVSVGGLVPGIYIAIASDGRSRLTLKFVVR